ncbi:pentapeptide repeat-containing protein [Chamaesiphon sp. VAR_69_metabat_338]|uniref:pentapeptide repeat-containing protein n=1 Tax=Chamaesiphon sp. VAR_69_metabat_338 TaxID=2964704 RepID=UPI00286DC911|nr:pentapeptide repeat-containing protein [Chamaesiphon sp. VAR_69_metabat_338]
MNDLDNSTPEIESAIQIVGSDLPDFKIHGYQVSDRLSEHAARGRTTYLASEIETEQLVVIKEWRQFDVRTPAPDYANYLPEIARLQQLDSPNVSRYLNSFQTPTGFCLVREYLPGVSIAELGTLPPTDVRLVADAILNILDYLHHLTPVVIHQNIKPENIIVDTETDLSIYLVDFGLHPYTHEPQNSYQPKLLPAATEAYDLYSLGISMICSLTGTSTSQAQHLFDTNYRLNFQHLIPANTDPKLIAWLTKMVESNHQQHYLDTFTNRSIKTDRSPVSLSGYPSTDRQEQVSFQMPEPKPPVQWWRWGVGAGILLALAVIGRQFVFPSSDELTPAQIAKNQSIAQEAEFAASDRGRLIKEKRCISCNLTNQNFAKADLAGAVLLQSILTGANFADANLTLAIFQDADLSGANLSRANLQKAALYGAKLNGTNLTGANLDRAKLVYAKLKGASLRDTILTNADLKFAEFQQVDLRNANLTGADLSNADLSYSNLSKAILTNTKLDGTTLTGTTMPDGSVHP